jgi:hypothetical protein
MIGSGVEPSDRGQSRQVDGFPGPSMSGNPGWPPTPIIGAGLLAAAGAGARSLIHDQADAIIAVFAWDSPSS